MPRIALTSGEPAGVGPELCLALAGQVLPCELVCLADRDMLQERAAKLGLAVTLTPYVPGARSGPGCLSVAHEPLAVPSEPGKLDPRNSAYVLRLIDRAIAATLAGEFDAMVTAPVQKSVINEAGIAFTGHTEYLAERLGAVPVMLLATGELRVALATTHLPLREVSAALGIDSLCATATTLADELRRGFGIAEPRIAVCGLNPHAGEGGYLGDEEIRVIGPAIARLQSRGIRASGPLPADTVFLPQVLARFDAVLAMYHDQGLPVVKHAGFEHAVNVTLGLPIVRTSPDHGTALDLAGSGRADPRSLLAAVQLAGRLAVQRH
ncbi:MAG: 4-hydroxythreonine-4-phosphate dehydrogenase PdxA [Proteobacteria bacterium]|nr:4-hydroxythreonine-4-phosphate dehydrogenase PdxA [Pseudomonadota bacterium]